MLEHGARGLRCAEGDRLVLTTASKALPVVRMAGSTLTTRSLTQTDDMFVGEFELFIDTWAGRTLIELTDGPKTVPLVLDIQPHQLKLDDKQFDEMLEELSQRSPTLVWGLAAGTAAGSIRPDALAVVHPVLLDNLFPTLERLLARFCSDPPTSRKTRRDARPLDLMRRADLTTLRWLGRRPVLLSALRGETVAHGHANARTPLDQPLNWLSTDHPVTRYVAHLLRRLVRRFEASIETLHKRDGPFSDPLADAHANELAQRLEQGVARLQSFLNRPLFRQLRSEPVSETALQSMADHPLYSALQRTARRLLEPGLAYGPGGQLEGALKRTYDLFELFVLFRMVEQIPELMGEGWRPKSARPLRYRGREHSPPDRSAWWFEGPDGFSLELRYQQWFSRAKSAVDDRMFASLSGLNIPDYLLVLRRGPQVISWVILDAKYRSGRQAVDQGLGDVHRYRDALRIRRRKADGAFVIVPRLQDTAPAYSNSDYHREHAFGVLQIFETDWLRPVRAALLSGVA